MSTARDIVTRALIRTRIVAPDESPSALEEAHGLGALNDMMFGWAGQGVDIGHSALALSDTFVFFLPPLQAPSDTISALSPRGNWNASTNSPALATNTGTDGYWYRVATAGNTVLNDVTSWAKDDYAVFVTSRWLKGRSSRQHEGGVIAMLGMQMCADFGKDVPDVLARDAIRGWRNIQAMFIKPKLNNTVDVGLVNMPSRRFIPDGTILG